jgi:hypothetical protein
MSSVKDVSAIPTAGKRLVIVAAVGHELHFRIFDNDGKMVVHTNATQRTAQASLIEGLRYRLKNLWPPHQLTGYDLRLMPTVTDVSAIPTAGKRLVIVVRVNDVLHFRIFDNDGKMVVDTDEALTLQLHIFRMGLENLRPPHELTTSEKDRVIDAVKSIVGHTQLTTDEKDGVIDAVTLIVGHTLFKPPSHMTQRTLAFLARLKAKRQRWPEAAWLLAELIQAQHPDPKRARAELAVSLSRSLTGTADPSAAGPLLAECREALKVPLGGGDWLAAEVASRYGDCLRRQDRFAEAEPILVAAAHEIQKGVGVPPWGVTAARKRVADLYEAWSRPADAAKWR